MKPHLVWTEHRSFGSRFWLGHPVGSNGSVLNAVATVDRRRGSWTAFVMGQPVDGTWATVDEARQAAAAAWARRQQDHP